MPWGGGHHGVDLPLGDIGGRTLVIDGYSGDLFIEPNQVILTEYRQLLSEERALDTLVRSVDNQPSETADGTKGLSAAPNAGLSADTEISLNHLADGVGLYRTEIPFMLQDSFPSEWEQTAAIAGSWKPIRGSPGLHADSGRGDKATALFPPSWRKIPSLVGRGSGSPWITLSSSLEPAQGHVAGQRRAGQSGHHAAG